MEKKFQMKSLVGKKFNYTKGLNWRTTDGIRHCQFDTYLCKVTFENDRRIEYAVIERVKSVDTAPFDNGGAYAGGIAKWGIEKYIADGSFKWV